MHIVLHFKKENISQITLAIKQSWMIAVEAVINTFICRGESV